MFGDAEWDGARTSAQQERWTDWLRTVWARRPGALTVIECGAGTAVPTVRWFTEHLVQTGASLVRINPREPAVPGGQVGLATGALAALLAIDEALG
jgi:hypothetical protein